MEVASSQPTPEQPEQPFAVGQHLLIHGLLSKPEFNHRIAEVLTPLYNGRQPVRLLDGAAKEIRLKPSNLERTDKSPKEGSVVDGRVMRYGEWFDIQAVLDKSMNGGEAAGSEFAALGAREQADVLAGRRGLDVPTEVPPRTH